MGLHDNPSADKFGPPGVERFEPPRPPRRRQWLAAFLALFALIATIAADRVHTTAGTVLTGTGLFGVTVAEIIMSIRARNAREEASRPHLHETTPR